MNAIQLDLYDSLSLCRTRSEADAPQLKIPPENHQHYELWLRVRESISALPSFFSSEISMAGIPATDVFTLGGALAAAIEEQVVQTLNGMRHVWDKENQYALYSFIRQSQTFPDVLLAKRSPLTGRLDDILFGIELKGWYVMSKEGEPSFRYVVTPNACTEWDLLVIVPWYLSNIISGTPRVLSPFSESALYSAEYRNYHWQNLRRAESSTGIIHPENACPYPQKSQRISDKPIADDGANFGRLARTGLLDDYINGVMIGDLAGIPIEHWRQFFQTHRQAA